MRVDSVDCFFRFRFVIDVYDFALKYVDRAFQSVLKKSTSVASFEEIDICRYGSFHAISSRNL